MFSRTLKYLAQIWTLSSTFEDTPQEKKSYVTVARSGFTERKSNKESCVYSNLGKGANIVYIWVRTPNLRSLCHRMRRYQSGPTHPSWKNHEKIWSRESPGQNCHRHFHNNQQNDTPLKKTLKPRVFQVTSVKCQRLCSGKLVNSPILVYGSPGLRPPSRAQGCGQWKHMRWKLVPAGNPSWWERFQVWLTRWLLQLQVGLASTTLNGQLFARRLFSTFLHVMQAKALYT